MRVLLTGATGFVGSHLLEKLIKTNVPVAMILREESDCWRIKHVLNKIMIITADLSDYTAMENSIINFKPDTLVHLAWHGVENRCRNEHQQISINIAHVINLLKVVEKTGIKKIIGFGSQGEYGPQNKQIDEMTLPQPTTLYGAAKLSAYYLFDTFSRQSCLDFCWIRLFSIYGPKDNDSWLIPTVIKQLLAGKTPALTEGKQLWDFLYIDDAVNAIVHVLHENRCSGIFNLGSGSSHTIREVVEIIRDKINLAIEPGFGLIPYRPDQVMLLKAKIDKIKSQTGWCPEISIDQGIQFTIEWYKK